MPVYLPLSFIEEKVKDLENALFFSMSEAVLKLPTCVVKILKQDDLGQLWFAISKPARYIHEIDQAFPVKLDFFRKGRDYYLKISGKAFIVTDPEEINSILYLDEDVKKKAMTQELVLIKVKISHADYAEKTLIHPKTSGVLKQFKTKVYSWLQQTNAENPLAFRKSSMGGFVPANVFSN